VNTKNPEPDPVQYNLDQSSPEQAKANTKKKLEHIAQKSGS
jgi:hypothetical protein